MPSPDIDQTLENFPHPIINPIIGVPTYSTIAEINLKLNANAASIHSNLGNGALGLLALTVTTEVFNTLSNVLFVAPGNPGALPAITANATGPKLQELKK